jgi:hypothetical protein
MESALLANISSPFGSIPEVVGEGDIGDGTNRVVNQTRLPQDGHGASPEGREGSSRRSLPQTGQRLGLPSGVRDEMFMDYFGSSFRLTILLSSRLTQARR